MAKRVTPVSALNSQPRYVAYYRVSTQKQGKSGLGLETQQAAVTGFVKGPILAEFTEVESGKNNQRTELTKAIDKAKLERATLVIAKLDRLSRNASFIFALKDSGVDFQCVDMPDANTLTVGIFATLAQHERELISSRTRSALAAKKAQGAELGKPDNLTHSAQLKGAAANRAKAVNGVEAKKALGYARSLRDRKQTFAEIAQALNSSGFRTARGAQYFPAQVQRLLNRADNV
jgi:DNA invertase Pin-like site-specific DNA recombinase